MTATMRFPESVGAFAVANTPSFLVRKLRADPEVNGLKSKGSENLLRELAKSVKKKPKSLEDAVLPYVFIVALSLTDDGNALRKAASFKPRYARWYSEIATQLLSAYKPSTYVTLSVLPQVKSFQSYSGGY